jgi:hypothetical protein
VPPPPFFKTHQEPSTGEGKILNRCIFASAMWIESFVFQLSLKSGFVQPSAGQTLLRKYWVCSRTSLIPFITDKPPVSQEKSPDFGVGMDFAQQKLLFKSGFFTFNRVPR